MDLSRYTSGERISAGKIYRRIKNDPAHFDFETGTPDLPAFVPRPQDRGALSADLDIENMIASLAQAQHAGFGLCEIDIERIVTETGGRAWVEYAPGRNRTHVRVHGCDHPEVQAILASLARMTHNPRRP